jgi:hypothetical protein
MTSRQCVRHTQLSSGVVNAISSIRSDAMNFFDWLVVLFWFATALYLVFDGPGLTPPRGDDEGRL